MGVKQKLVSFFNLTILVNQIRFIPVGKGNFLLGGKNKIPKILKKNTDL